MLDKSQNETSLLKDSYSGLSLHLKKGGTTDNFLKTEKFHDQEINLLVVWQVGYSSKRQVRRLKP